MILGREDPLEEKMATHSSNFAWRIPVAREAGSQRGRRDSAKQQQLDLSSRHITKSEIAVGIQKLLISLGRCCSFSGIWL